MNTDSSVDFCQSEKISNIDYNAEHKLGLTLCESLHYWTQRSCQFVARSLWKQTIDFNARGIHERTLRRHFGMFVMNGFWFCQNANEAVKLHSF